MKLVLARGALNVPAEHPAVTRVRTYLESHTGEPVALADLSRIARLSKSHLVRLFRAQVGTPPHAYHTQVRVRRARTLLAEGEPIASAAQAAGFADQSHLTRHFKYYLGLTPGAFVRTSRLDQAAGA